MFKQTRVLILSIVVFIAACSPEADYYSESDSIKVRPEVGVAPERIELPQGWNSDIRKKFWFTSQGSRIIPYSWFTWLEQADSQALFRDAKHIEMLRYLPVNSSPENPSGLPIGFVAAHDKQTDQAWVGMTCAACHTNQLDYKGNKFLIEGAPTLANFVLFYRRLVEALDQTNSDSAKFDRFARNVLGESYTTGAASELRNSLQSVALSAAERLEVNRLPDGYPADFTSYARLDAFGNIQNAGTAFALHDLNNRNTPNGPVSYPFLWGTHQSDRVQWNASAPNTPVIGPLARNVGEVIGVFGNLSMEKAPWWKRLFGIKVSYSSNVDIEGLGRLESWVKTLRSPQWPAEYFPAIDIEAAAKGAELFAGLCSDCHQVIPRDKEGKKYRANRTPVDDIGTDPVTAWNADRRCADTLLLEGTKKEIFAGATFGKEAAAISIPVNGAVGVILGQPKKSLEAGLRPLRAHSRLRDSNDLVNASTAQSDESSLDSAADNHEKSVEDYVNEHLEARREIGSGATNELGQRSCGDHDAVLVYKGRPLNGIWATAPYLHNGSVPNLWELLREGSQRSDRFWVGSREFDPVKVGYLTSEGLNEFKVNDENGNVRPGNSNLGHEYGTQWTDQQKWAVIEYMKTL